MARLWFSNLTTEGQLSSEVTGSETSLSFTGYQNPPSVPHEAVIDRDTPSEEIVTVTAISSGTMTVTRGAGGTTPTSHSMGATIEHVISATGANKWDAHVEATGSVHGVTGDLVGTDESQTLSNKTIEDSTYAAQNTTSPGTGPLFGARVDTTTRAGFSVDATGISEAGTAFLVEQSGSDRFAVHANGSVSIAPSGSGLALDVTGDAEVSGDLDVGGDLGVTGDVGGATLTVGGAASVGSLTSDGGGSFAGNLSATGNLSVSAITASSDVSVSGDITATGDVTASGTVQAADLTATDDLTVGDDATITGSLSAEGGKLTTVQSSGQTVLRTQVTTTDGAITTSARQPWVFRKAYTTSMPRTIPFEGVNLDIPFTVNEDCHIKVLIHGWVAPTAYVGPGVRMNSAVFQTSLRSSGGTLIETGPEVRASVGDDGAGGFIDSPVYVVNSYKTRLSAGADYIIRVRGIRNSYGNLGMVLNLLAAEFEQVVNLDG